MSDLSSKDYVKVYGQVQKLADYRIKPIARVIHSDTFEMLIALVIVVNAVCLAILTFPNIDPDTRQLVLTLDYVCLGIFVVELIVRMISYGKKHGCSSRAVGISLTF